MGGGKVQRNGPRARLAREQGWARSGTMGQGQRAQALIHLSEAMTLGEVPGPQHPAPRGREDTVRESKPAPKKRKTNYPHPTSTLYPPASWPMGTLLQGRENHRPTPPIRCLAWAQQKGVGAGGPTTSHAPSPLQPPSLPKGARIPSPLSGIPSCPVLMSLDSHPQRRRQELTEP